MGELMKSIIIPLILVSFLISCKSSEAVYKKKHVPTVGAAKDRFIINTEKFYGGYIVPGGGEIISDSYHLYNYDLTIDSNGLYILQLRKGESPAIDYPRDFVFKKKWNCLKDTLSSEKWILE
jgi:hypothetical protein